jgi:hypothetical protein
VYIDYDDEGIFNPTFYNVIRVKAGDYFFVYYTYYTSGRFHQRMRMYVGWYNGIENYIYNSNSRETDYRYLKMDIYFIKP